MITGATAGILGYSEIAPLSIPPEAYVVAIIAGTAAAVKPMLDVWDKLVAEPRRRFATKDEVGVQFGEVKSHLERIEKRLDGHNSRIDEVLKRLAFDKR